MMMAPRRHEVVATNGANGQVLCRILRADSTEAGRILLRPGQVLDGEALATLEGHCKARGMIDPLDELVASTAPAQGHGAASMTREGADQALWSYVRAIDWPAAGEADDAVPVEWRLEACQRRRNQALSRLPGVLMAPLRERLLALTTRLADRLGEGGALPPAIARAYAAHTIALGEQAYHQALESPARAREAAREGRYHHGFERMFPTPRDVRLSHSGYFRERAEALLGDVEASLERITPAADGSSEHRLLKLLRERYALVIQGRIGHAADRVDTLHRAIDKLTASGQVEIDPAHLAFFGDLATRYPDSTANPAVARARRAALSENTFDKW
ncbi:hypothetical protein J2T57_001734 [Natronocella acetinitrilica]|uniref:Uncharacterized protein n=1 Tax=Natronocella acetinitrilica TaxID=414046 RepID=A0AAE3KFZ5_9GAMM|nr:hypothetical protein [Natronocella acetinitrilica]MCP1674632.1 hypothetical protein [Natronocella acetinitrilica]